MEELSKKRVTEVSAAEQDGPELPDVIAMGKGDARC